MAAALTTWAEYRDELKKALINRDLGWITKSKISNPGSKEVTEFRTLDELRGEYFFARRMADEEAREALGESEYTGIVIAP